MLSTLCCDGRMLGAKLRSHAWGDQRWLRLRQLSLIPLVSDAEHKPHQPGQDHLQEALAAAE